MTFRFPSGYGEVGMNYGDFLNLVKNRRSMRSFKPDQVSDEDIDKILEAARWAPSGMNFQPWEFIVVKDREKIHSILRLRTMRPPGHRPENMRRWLSNALGRGKVRPVAPVLIVVCGDTRRMINLPGQGYEMVDSKISLKEGTGLDQRSIFVSSLSNAFLLALLAAESIGLAAQYVTFTTLPHIQDKIKEILDLPDYLEIYETMALGYRAYEPGPKYVRPLQDMVHHEKFDISKSMTDGELLERAKSRADLQGIS
jgi:nitroreductase